MTDHLTGRCHCGAVTFKLTLPSDFAGHCHCEDCRRLHAAPLVTWTSIPNERFEWLKGADQVSWYRSSPPVQRGFCGVCGAHLAYRADHTVGRTYVPVATLDGLLDRAPSAHVMVKDAVPWLGQVADGLPRFDRYD